MTRTRLLDAAATVFARRGIASASLEEVAEEAGLTKGAVYSNFESKDDLIGALIHERIDDQTGAIAGLVSPEGSAEEQAAQAGGLFMRVFEQERDAWLLAFEFSIHLARNPELAGPFYSRYGGLQATMARVMAERAAEHGTELPLPAKELAAGLFALGQGIALARLSDPEGVPEDLFAKMLAVIFRGQEPGPRRRRAGTGGR